MLVLGFSLRSAMSIGASLDTPRIDPAPRCARDVESAIQPTDILLVSRGHALLYLLRCRSEEGRSI